MIKRVVIIGAGISGHTTAINLRTKDKDCLITLITEESYPCYDRRKLADFLAGTIKEEEILCCTDNFYPENNINFRKETKVSAVNTERKVVYLKDKGSIEYDFLVIASGRNFSLPQIPGIRKEGVFSFNTLIDVKNFMGYIFTDTVCVVGRDQTAINVANIITKRFRVEVKLISKNELIEPPIEQGTEVICDCVQDILGEGKVQAIRLSQGKVIGVEAIIFIDELKTNIEFLKETNIELSQDNSILVDDCMKTNIDGVFACGSVCKNRINIQDKSYDTAIIDANRVVDNLVKNFASAKVLN